jgi:hypothetical protein
VCGEGQQPAFFQVGEDVADGRRADVQARVARQRLRTDRFAVADVAADQRAQQVACARIEVAGSRPGGRALGHGGRYKPARGRKRIACNAVSSWTANRLR